MTEHYPESLAKLGWDSFFESHYETMKVPGSIPCRVAYEYKYSCQLFSADGELSGSMSGRLRYVTDDHPSVGDWVVAVPYAEGEQATIHAILPRKSKFARQAPSGEEQIVAANINTVFIVTALDGKDYNRRRIERYCTMAWKSGALPVIVLNKSDLCSAPDTYIRDAEAVAPGVPVHTVSAMERTGLENLYGHITEGQTVAFLGSSGVGKSALINTLLGSERQATGEIKISDMRGRHTTTRRELIMLPTGGLVVDTPGMRELRMWGNEGDLGGSFEDVETLAAQCRFNDCSHDSEPGCVVREALESGELDEGRYRSYLKLKKELKYISIKEDTSARMAEQLRWKSLSKYQKQVKKHKFKDR